MRIVTLAALLAAACGAPASPTGSGGGAGDMAVGGAPVSLRNPAIRNLQNGGYSLTFVLTDNVVVSNGSRDIAQVDLMRWTWGADKLTANIDCGDTPWNTPQPTTGLIGVTANTSPTSLTFAWDCGLYQSRTMAGLSINAPPSGTVHVAFDGELKDATPFTAEADVPVL
jgi:hypothetical protein